MNLLYVLLAVTLAPYVIYGSIIPWPPRNLIISQRIDHFDIRSSFFNQLTLYEDKYWNFNGPILFYCGNEGAIGGFWNNTGFMFEYARDIGALVVFAEHRYYGESLPHGAQSFSQVNISHLSIMQVLADYAHVVNSYRRSFRVPDNMPTIAFGGSYGGILAGLMRLKYPFIIEGALASSAPFRWLASKGDLHDMFPYITQVYRNVDLKCPVIIKEGLDIIQHAESSKFREISELMNLCTHLRDNYDIFYLLQWSRNAFIDMAMMDYPYSSNLLRNLPANPVNVACNQLSNYGTHRPIRAVKDAVAVYYNSTGDLNCFDIHKEFKPCADITGCGEGDSAIAWDYQACTEMRLYDPSNSTLNSMFPSLPLTLRNLEAHCLRKWGVLPNFYKFQILYSDANFRDTSNIIFSNGDLDPWRLGGILQNVSDSVVAFNIAGGAHHYDLRESNVLDTTSVKLVRLKERTIMNTWILNYRNKH